MQVEILIFFWGVVLGICTRLLYNGDDDDDADYFVILHSTFASLGVSSSPPSLPPLSLSAPLAKIPVYLTRNSHPNLSLRHILLRPNHQLRPHQAIKLLRAQRTQLHRRLTQRQPLLMRVLGDLTRGIVANTRVQARDEHKTLLHDRRDLLLIRSQPSNEVLLKRP